MPTSCLPPDATILRHAARLGLAIVAGPSLVAEARSLALRAAVRTSSSARIVAEKFRFKHGRAGSGPYDLDRRQMAREAKQAQRPQRFE